MILRRMKRVSCLHLKRGVLSEDAVYNLITDHSELMERMQRAVLKSIEKKEF